jgi:hypothetical protein
LHREWGDREPMDVFNRLMAKQVGLVGRTANTHTNFSPLEIRSRKEQWGTEALGQLTRGHGGIAGPRTRLDGPIVLVEYEGRVLVLDGNHRINTWVQKNDPGLHSVNIHTIGGPAYFVELAASR